MSAVKNSGLLSEEQMQYAYQLGVMDRALNSSGQKSFVEVLQNGTESDKIKEKEQEGVDNESREEGSGVHLRDGGERKNGKSTGGNLSSMEGRTGEAEERGSGSDQEKRSASIRAFVEAEGLSKVSSKSAGVETGTDRANIVVIPESEYDDGMRQIVEEQAAQGKKVVFVSGSMEFYADGVLVDDARGAISADGKTMWIQADDAFASPEQIVLHEEYHAKVKSDPSLMSRMKKKIKEKYKGKLALLTKVYANIYYRDAPLTEKLENIILEEIFADAYAGIDVLETFDEAEVRATEFSEDIRESAKNIESARAPPSSGEVKASRKNKDLYTATDDFIRDVVKEDRSAFARSLAYKTNGMRKGEIRVVTIYAGGIYLFKADGYMHGEMIPFSKKNNLKEIKSFIEEKKHEFEETERSIDKWESDERNARILNGGSYSFSNGNGGYHGSSDRIGERDTTKENDSLFDEQSSSNPSRNNEQSRRHNYSTQEIDAILDPLKKMYGADDAGIKASRSLKSHEDVVQAYLDAVPNRLILANALESQADNPKAKELLEKYKSNIANIEADQAELDKTKSELHELYFSKGKRNTERIKTLESRKEKLEARIDNADRWLLKYEETKPIKDIIARERDRAYKKAIAEGNAKIAKMQARMKDREQKARKERLEFMLFGCIYNQEHQLFYINPSDKGDKLLDLEDNSIVFSKMNGNEFTLAYSF